MAVSDLLDRLERVKSTGPGKWIARCPAHADKNPSLAVREMEDGRVLVHCFPGCNVNEVLSAVGLEMDALFPPRPVESAKAERRPFFPADVFDIIRSELNVALVIIGDVYRGRTPPAEDWNRLLDVSDRLSRISGAAYARH